MKQEFIEGFKRRTEDLLNDLEKIREASESVTLLFEDVQRRKEQVSKQEAELAKRELQLKKKQGGLGSKLDKLKAQERSVAQIRSDNMEVETRIANERKALLAQQEGVKKEIDQLNNLKELENELNKKEEDIKEREASIERDKELLRDKHKIVDRMEKELEIKQKRVQKMLSD